MRTTKDLLIYLSFESYFRELIHNMFKVSNSPEWLQSEMQERERFYKLRQDMTYIAICMIERGEY